MTVVLLVALVWPTLGIGVVLLCNLVKGQYARGSLGTTASAARQVDGPSRSGTRS
jgi:hypothetical protein